MKRLLSILLALMLCMTAFSVLAEETVSEFANDEVGLTVQENALPKVELKEASQATKAGDDVVNQNNVYTIKTPDGLTITLNAANLSSFLVLTQSYYASLDIYSRFKDDATATKFIDELIDGNAHIVIWDAYEAFQSIVLQTSGSSALTKHVKNLGELRESDIKMVANQIAVSNNVSDYTLYTFNGNVWIQLKANVLVTIVNSEYVVAFFYPNGDTMTDDDYDDFTKFMRALTLS
jgi:NACalpha-BTF3-like transcription factor